MKRPLLTLPAALLVTAPALAALPMGLKCDPSIKIVAAEVGQIGSYQVQKGMQKETHSGMLNKKSVAPVDLCSYEQELAPGKVLSVRYIGPEVQDTEVQCVDLANNNAPVVFPKSLYTVRVPNMAPHMLMPYCPDGNTSDGFACSKLDSQSERGNDYRDTVMKWKANDPRTKQFKIDLQFDPPYVMKRPPYTPTVPAGAKLFCAAVNKKGEVVIAGTVQYAGAGSPAPAVATTTTTTPTTTAPPAAGTAANTVGAAAATNAVNAAATAASASPAGKALDALGRLRRP
jgi:hypothetical protein